VGLDVSPDLFKALEKGRVSIPLKTPDDVAEMLRLKACG